VCDESTSRDLVERTRVILDAADRADFDAILKFYAPDAVWELRAGGTFRGVDAIRDLWEDYYRPYEEFGIDVEEVLDFGGGVILTVSQQNGRPLGSTAYIRTREAFIYEWSEGLVARVTTYDDIAEARAAAERLAESRE
jgi:ketosteroid isomerase-like protein